VPVSLLVVDDSAVSRAKLRKLFEAAGYEVDLAVDGEEALARFATKPYAVLITDLEMPKVDGFQVIAAVQNSLDAEDLPIIAITGHEELSARVHDMKGLYGIFRKPWNDRELLKRVAAVSTLRRQAATD
jgi:CheY-like chemotaxis protein